MKSLIHTLKEFVVELIILGIFTLLGFLAFGWIGALAAFVFIGLMIEF